MKLVACDCGIMFMINNNYDFIECPVCKKKYNVFATEIIEVEYML